MPSKYFRNSLSINVAIQLSFMAILGGMLSSPLSTSVGAIPVPQLNSDQLNSSNSATGFVRRYRLYHDCSGKFVRVTSKHVDIKESHESQSPYYDLSVETVAVGLVRLQGVASKHYVCLNKDGKIIARVRPTDSCVFRESISVNMRTEFESLALPGRFIAFVPPSRHRHAGRTTTPTTPSPSTSQEQQQHHQLRHRRRGARRGKHQPVLVVEPASTPKPRSRTNHDRNGAKCRQFLKIGENVDEESRDGVGHGVESERLYGELSRQRVGTVGQ